MELYHHGVKGQKWGVQNGPPYPLEKSKRQTIRKGSSFYRVSSNSNEDPSRRTYVTTKIGDSKIYLLRAKTIDRDLAKGSANGYLVEYKSKEQIKLASQTSVNKTFKDIINKYSDKEICDKVYGKDKYEGDTAKLLGSSIRRAFNNPKKWNNESLTINRFLAKGGYDIEKNEIVIEAFNSLKKTGFDGFKDFYDKGAWSQSPMVLFDKSKLMQTKITDMKNIEYDTLYKEVEEYIRNSPMLNVKIDDIVKINK